MLAPSFLRQIRDVGAAAGNRDRERAKGALPWALRCRLLHRLQQPQKPAGWFATAAKGFCEVTNTRHQCAIALQTALSKHRLVGAVGISREDHKQQKPRSASPKARADQRRKHRPSPSNRNAPYPRQASGMVQPAGPQAATLAPTQRPGQRRAGHAPSNFRNLARSRTAGRHRFNARLFRQRQQESRIAQEPYANKMPATGMAAASVSAMIGQHVHQWPTANRQIQCCTLDPRCSGHMARMARNPR